MKVKICKKSLVEDKWYDFIPLPLEIEVEYEGKHLYKVSSGEYLGRLVNVSDCFNNEEYSKEERVFESGAKRDSDKNKPYCHNLQGYTRLRFGYHTRMGADKYGDGNFLLGMPKDQAIQSNDRHWAKYLAGDRAEDHLSAMIFNIQLIMLVEKEEGIKEDYYFNKIKNETKN